MKIGITGATGQLGRLVVEQLKERVNSNSLVALVRNTQKAKNLGIEAREFDYNRPEILTVALNNLDTLLLISSSEIGKREEQHKNVINAAREAGIKWIVYTSLLHADNSSLNLKEEHIATENAIKESGIDFTILRNGWYSENYAGAIPGAITAGVFVGSVGDGKISSAARADYAEAAAVVLADESHKGKVYELAGDESYTLSELAKEISLQTGKDIPYKNLHEAEYTKVLIGTGLPEGIASFLAHCDTGASINDLFNDSHQLSKLIGRQTTPMSQTVKSVLTTMN